MVLVGVIVAVIPESVKLVALIPTLVVVVPCMTFFRIASMSRELSRTFAFQNAAVSTSPVGVEGKRRGRCVGYHSPYE